MAAEFRVGVIDSGCAPSQALIAARSFWLDEGVLCEGELQPDRLGHGSAVLASLQAEGENWLLIESHCPICVAAQACQGFCRSELQVFQTALGDSATVERIEHLISGDRRCVYRVSPRRPHP